MMMLTILWYKNDYAFMIIFAGGIAVSYNIVVSKAKVLSRFSM